MEHPFVAAVYSTGCSRTRNVDDGAVVGIGRDRHGRTVLAVAVDNWLLDELAAFGADLEDREPEPDEDDGP